MLVSWKHLVLENETARRCVIMRKRLMLIRATNWQLTFLYRICRFQNINMWHTFQMSFTRPCTTLLFTLKWITSALVRFFESFCFIADSFLIMSCPWSRTGSGFQTMPNKNLPWQTVFQKTYLQWRNFSLVKPKFGQKSLIIYL